MPKKPKYDYNIDNIQRLQNKGMSIIQIANHYGWCKVSCQAWINRNYTKSNRVYKEVVFCIVTFGDWGAHIDFEFIYS